KSRNASLLKLLSAKNTSVLFQNVHDDRLSPAQDPPVHERWSRAYEAVLDMAETGLSAQREQHTLRRREALPPMVSGNASAQLADMDAVAGGEHLLDLVQQRVAGCGGKPEPL